MLPVSLRVLEVRLVHGVEALNLKSLRPVDDEINEVGKSFRNVCMKANQKHTAALDAALPRSEERP
jgi:hypothetical protein